MNPFQDFASELTVSIRKKILCSQTPFWTFSKKLFSVSRGGDTT